MALSINQKGTVPLSNVSGATFTAKLQTAGSSTLYPEGTVFDCSAFRTETVTSTVILRRAGITLLFGEGDFTMSVPNQNMFEILAPNVTIIGVSRSARDSSSANGSTRFVMTSNTGGYHIASTPTGSNGWLTSHSVTIMNLDLVGVQSVYTASGGVATYTTQGAGGIFLSEGNPNAANQNINNVIISGVLIEGARRHGVMLYGAIASKLQNVRVRNAGGHGFYVTGSSTSVNLDTCFASGNHLAGYCIDETSYSTLNNCASDSNGLGYWMRSSQSITMSSCGAEGCIVRSSIPNNLGIVIPAQAGNVTINDIGADNVNFIKGTSFLFTGGSNITGTSCYSKDPSNRAGQSTFVSKYSAHVHAEYGTTKVNMDNFETAGNSPLKYKIRLGDVYNFGIDQNLSNYDPTNPTESPDGSMEPLAQILDQGSNNVFGDFADSTSFGNRTATIENPLANFTINQLSVEGRMRIPVGTANPANAQAGSIYFNTAQSLLYIFDGSTWHNTCCASVPLPPACVFPGGGIQQIVSNGQGGLVQSSIAVGDDIYFTTKSVGTGFNGINTVLFKFSTVTETVTPINLGFPNASYLSYSTLAFSQITNSLYFGMFLSGGNAQPFGVGDDQYLIKYNLSTNSVDATVVLNELTQPEAESIDNLLGVALYNVPSTEDYLYQISTYGPNNVDVIITTRDLNTLATHTTIVGDPTPTWIEKLNRPQQQNTYNIPGSIHVVMGNNRCINGQPFEFYTLHTGSGTWTTYSYGSSPAPLTAYSPMVISKTETPDDSFFISNRITNTIYEISYDDFSTLDLWDVGSPVFNVFDKTVNGKRILTYLTAVLNSQTSLYDLYITAYNATDGLILGSPLSLGITTTTNELNNTAASHLFYDSLVSNYFFDIVASGKIYKYCSPYVA